MEYLDFQSTAQPPRQPGGIATTSSTAYPPSGGHLDTQNTKNSSDDGRGATPVGTPLDHRGSISISTAFHPGLVLDGATPDTVLVATDSVYFYAHRAHLLAMSANYMGGLIPPPQPSASPPTSAPLLTVRLPHTSNVVNVVLHTLYGMSCLRYFPALETVEAAVEALQFIYSVPVHPHAAPTHPLYTLILSFAPFRPLDAYTLAAHHGLEELAVAISPHLLAYDLARIPDSMAQRMGPLYLKRLFLLHQSRLFALRNILLRPPAPHPLALMPGCNEEKQQRLMRAWALAVAQLVWDVLPNVSTGALRSLLEPIGASSTCSHCISAVQRRVEEVVFEWSSVKRTI